MIIPIDLGEKSYEIILERGAAKKAGRLLGIDESRKVLIVTDSGVPREHLDAVACSFKRKSIFVFPEGEQSKNFDTYREICETLMKLSFTRKDAVVAVGGGVTGDMAGFAAATYMRGIDFYNIPTTLLSQVDSSIGGKTAIDLGRIKNIIGAFHQPKRVIIDPDVLTTLPERHLRNGLAEALKAGIIMDKELFEIFERGEAEEKIDEVIERSLRVKKRVVEEDEKETGLRKVLNFGHTVGHGIEASVPFGELYHGECVALGMIPMCGEAIRGRVVSALEKTGLPVSYPFDREKVRQAVCHDKKSVEQGVTAVFSDEIGSFVFKDTTIDELMKLI
ncbi:MAG: 3-dehydroquinate synthase [Ruminococcaceae bacterium]|nr:3-dehydroquinate synthase [Oscillospiraceae bacterium]